MEGRWPLPRSPRAGAPIPPLIPRTTPVRVSRALRRHRGSAVPRPLVVDLARFFRGLPAAELERLGEWVVEDELWPTRRMNLLAELAAHVNAGRRVALLSAMYQPVVDALARVLGAEAYGTGLEMREGAATGEVASVNSGPEKSRRLGRILGRDTLVAAYGDTLADLAMLEASASPVAVAPDRALLRVALARRWRIIPG